ncbi:MAG: pimeloyl-CoA dehydrogenase large subunit, partial [Deltaproteobacteria bacterium]
MDLSFTPEENAFRQAVRSFVQSRLPADIQKRTLEGRKQTHDDYKRWHRLLYEQGWGAPTWPKEYGGPGWGAVEQYIFEEESAAAGAPLLSPFGLKMVGPVIYTFGSDAQKERFLPRIRSAEHSWCQGYSEPGSGSDLASLKTRAERRGDGYVVNGQKTWITHAQYADYIFCLVRTDPKAKQQQGISFLLIDMKTPGITVRPIVTMDGGKEINEVFFEDVHVPVEN